jgi:hypothetical protein
VPPSSCGCCNRCNFCATNLWRRNELQPHNIAASMKMVGERAQEASRLPHAHAHRKICGRVDRES